MVKQTDKKAGHVPGFSCNDRSRRVLRCLNVASLHTLRSCRDFERNLLSFLERFEALHVDRGEVCKQIFATAIGRDVGHNANGIAASAALEPEQLREISVLLDCAIASTKELLGSSYLTAASL
jgi:hypothetical protein